MKSAEKKSFKIYKEWQKQFSALDNETAGELIKAVFAYQTMGEMPKNMSPVAEMALSFMCQQFERDNESYDEISRVRSEAGKKGGAPLGNSNAKKNKDVNFNENQSKITKNKQNNLEDEEEVEDEEEDVDVVSSSTEETDDEINRENFEVKKEKIQNLPDLILKNGEKFAVTSEKFERYKQLYPDVDVAAQLRCMSGWLEANPTRRKTKSGIERFVVGWLTREQTGGSEKKQTVNGGKNDAESGAIVPEKLRQAGFDGSIEDFLQ